METKLKHAKSMRDNSENELKSALKDTEQFKNKTMRECLEQVAESYIKLFDKGKIVFETQKVRVWTTFLFFFFCTNIFITNTDQRDHHLKDTKRRIF